MTSEPLKFNMTPAVLDCLCTVKDAAFTVSVIEATEHPDRELQIVSLLTGINTGIAGIIDQLQQLIDQGQTVESDFRRDEVGKDWS